MVFVDMMVTKTTLGGDYMNEEQSAAFRSMENQLKSVGFTPIQALTMGLSYFKGGYYENLNESEFEVVVKHFVEEYM